MHPKTKRQLERMVVRSVVTSLIEAGYLLRVHDGEGFSIKHTSNTEEVMEALFACDEETIAAYWIKSGLSVGTVFLVYGNEPWEVVCDYTTTLEEALAPALRLGEQIEQTFTEEAV